MCKPTVPRSIFHIKPNHNIAHGFKGSHIAIETVCVIEKYHKLHKPSEGLIPLKNVGGEHQ